MTGRRGKYITGKVVVAAMLSMMIVHEVLIIEFLQDINIWENVLLFR